MSEVPQQTGSGEEKKGNDDNEKYAVDREQPTYGSSEELAESEVLQFEETKELKYVLMVEKTV